MMAFPITTNGAGLKIIDVLSIEIIKYTYNILK